MRDAPVIRFPLFRFATSLRQRLVSAFSVSAFQRFSIVSAFHIRRYFSSGWAFLIPYLTAYLLYYWLKWPVNPADAGVKVRVASESGTWVPCLLHVYWILHAVNVGLAAVALVSWWREQEAGDRRQEKGDGRQEAGDRRQSSDGLTQRREDAKALPAGFSQEVAKAGEEKPIACKQAPTASLPPVKWLGLRFLRFLDFTISRSSSRFPAFPLSRFAAALLPSPFSLLLQRIAPWFLLALVFYIPGVYLEWPADPWDHYARINEWSWLHTVGEHSGWAKSSYFLAYSFLGQISPPTRQLFWLDFYYTGCCLLLCWQYYRLARVVGLGERASMLFVILQAVLFGNNIFGFYRYYGISSSIFAQIGAVALTRVAIEYASQKFQVPRLKFQGTGASPSVTSLNTEDAESTESAGILGHEKAQDNTKALVPFFARLCAFLRQKQSAQPPAQLASESSAISVLKSGSVGSLGLDTPAAHGAVAAEQAPTVSCFPPSAFRFSSDLPSPVSCLLRAAACAALLAALIAFNHVQGLGIAGLGLLAVAIWRLIDWKRSMVWWLAAGALVLSVIAILWFPRDPALAGYVHDGWLTSWYGFNLFAFRLPVGDRTLQIVGVLGLVNLAAGLLLLRRNSLVGWLTLTPLLALCLPFIAIPFAGALARHGDLINIITFQRMLFAIPSGLAIVALGAQIAGDKFQVLRLKVHGTGEDDNRDGFNTENTERTEATERGKEISTTDEHGLPRMQNVSLPSLPSVESSREIAETAEGYQIACKQAPTVSRLRDFAISRFSTRFPGFSFSRFPGLLISRFSAPLLRSPFSLLLAFLTALLLVPANGPFYNRFWQALAVPPDDLQLKPVISIADSAAIRLQGVPHKRLATTPAVACVLGATFPRDFPYPDRYIGQSAAGPLNAAIAIALSSRLTIDSIHPSLIPDPLTTDHSAWTALGGSPPQFVIGIKDFRASSTALQNPAGQISEAFTSDLIPVDLAKGYQLELSIRQCIGVKATVYLAIAWYNEEGRLLESHIPAPAGAGRPVGWANGTYSYFGLIGETAPTIWTTYRKSFGLGEAAAIPANAKYVRVGALLNYNTTPAATIQLTNVRLWRKSETEILADGVFSSDERLLIIAPPTRMEWTYASQAGRASHHWPANEVAADLAGGVELAAAAHALGGTPVDRDNTTFELPEITDSPARVP